MKFRRNSVVVMFQISLYWQEKVLDKKTRLMMLKMVNSGIVNKINGVISGGKESVIIHCNGGR